MARPLRETTLSDIVSIKQSIATLKTARHWLVMAGALSAAKKTRSAIKSAEGALRHAEGAYARQEAGLPPINPVDVGAPDRDRQYIHDISTKGGL